MTATTAPARARRPKPSQRIERFFNRYLGYSLDPWQRETTELLFDTVDRRGQRVYKEALIGVGKGNSKTPFGAGLALDGLYNAPPEVVHGGVECYALASSRQQAHILFDDAKRMVLRHPILERLTKCYRDVLEVKETGAVFRVLSSDAARAHGYRPYRAVPDELWAHPKPDLYEAMSSALHKVPGALLVGFTTAGFDRTQLLWRLYQRGLRGDDPEFLFRWFAAPDGCSIDDTKAWRAANPSTRITIAQLRSQRRRLPEPVFRRLHLNQWTSTEETWIDMSLWDRGGVKVKGWRYDSHGPVIATGAPVVVAIDSAPKRDETWVIVCYRDPDTTEHWWREWRFEPNRTMGYLDYPAVKDLLRAIARTYDVRRMLFDPYNMMPVMVELGDEGLPVEEYPQSDAYMVPASQNLYDLVQGAKLHHSGSAEIRAHADAAVARETARGWRLDKLRSAGHIDGIVAGSIASRVAEQEAQLSMPGVFTFSDDELFDDYDE